MIDCMVGVYRCCVIKFGCREILRAGSCEGRRICRRRFLLGIFGIWVSLVMMVCLGVWG